MGRITWLAAELRAAGVEVAEVAGWRTRGSEDFDPIGITWHATAGSRNSTAQGEVNVILNGSTSAPPPIAQIMLYRDGVAYVCAAGRCNHNKVGWGGPNEGFGNTELIGIEMANDNRGEPFPAVQIDAARKISAAIFKRLGTSPLRRMAGHFEHQPGAKTDPLGVSMGAERSRVYALMTSGQEWDEMATEAQVKSACRAALREELAPDQVGRERVEAASVGYAGGPFEGADALKSLGWHFKEILENSRNAAARLAAIEARLDVIEGGGGA